MHQQMRDAELVLRFFAFKDSWQSFDGSIKGHMDNFMAQNQLAARQAVESFRASFYHALDVVEAAFGGHAFARYVAEKGRWRNQVVASVYDAQMLASKPYDALRAHAGTD